MAGWKAGFIATLDKEKIVSVVADIVQSWRNPRVVIQRHLARGRSEPFVFTFLFVFLILAFVAQWPEAARVSALNSNVPLSPQLLGRALALLATIPVWYGLAWLGRLAVGGRCDGYRSRLALFWTLVTISPLVLLVGLVTGMIGAGPQLWATGLVTFAAFLWFWRVNLQEVSRAT